MSRRRCRLRGLWPADSVVEDGARRGDGERRRRAMPASGPGWTEPPCSAGGAGSRHLFACFRARQSARARRWRAWRRHCGAAGADDGAGVWCERPRPRHGHRRRHRGDVPHRRGDTAFGREGRLPRSGLDRAVRLCHGLRVAHETVGRGNRQRLRRRGIALGRLAGVREIGLGRDDQAAASRSRRRRRRDRRAAGAARLRRAARRARRPLRLARSVLRGDRSEFAHQGPRRDLGDRAAVHQALRLPRHHSCAGADAARLHRAAWLCGRRYRGDRRRCFRQGGVASQRRRSWRHHAGAIFGAVLPCDRLLLRSARPGRLQRQDRRRSAGARARPARTRQRRWRPQGLERAHRGHTSRWPALRRYQGVVSRLPADADVRRAAARQIRAAVSGCAAQAGGVRRIDAARDAAIARRRVMSTSFAKLNTLVGSPVERIEDLRFLRGRGRYVDDIVRDGMLHAAILRSSVAHGRIRSIDATAALARSGVHAVITAADVLAALGAVPAIPMRQEVMPVFKPYEQPAIAQGKVRYVGEPIALVVADSQAIAEDALEAIELEIEALPAVTGPHAEAALLVESTGTNCAATLTALRGDADAAFNKAPYVRRERFRVQRHTAVPMESRGLLADWDSSRGHLTVYGAAKVAFTIRRILAVQLSLKENAITMVEGDVGGAFGVRGEFYPEDFLIPFASKTVGRPVKWIEDRRENLIATNRSEERRVGKEVRARREG